MTGEPVWSGIERGDQLRTVTTRGRAYALAAVLVVTLVGIIATAHVLAVPDGHLHPTLPGVLLVLWSLATLAALGGAYASLAGYLSRGPRVTLELLPADECRIVEPILETPGITQVEIVARSDFSDAKVSQTLTALRERGLVYREPQGRTYRLYPGTVLDEALGGGRVWRRR
jgi:uncharacterized membrane protein